MAAIALALWNFTVTPGKRFRYTPQADIRVTGAALGHELNDPSGRSTLKIYNIEPSMSDSDSDSDDDSPQTKKASKAAAAKDSSLIICSLTPGKIEQHSMDLILLMGHTIDFHVVGKNVIHLSGNYIHQDNQDPDEMDSSDDDDEAFPLGEWSSNVEESDDGLEEALGRFEEVPSDTEIAPAKTLKRPRDSDVMDEDEEAGKAQKLSKNERKKLKKLKNENGDAIAVGSDERKAASASVGDILTSQGEKKKDKKKGDKSTSEKKPNAEKKELEGGLIIQDAKVGTGPTAKKGSVLSMRYIGKLTNGKVFDSNTSGKPFKFKLGNGDVIAGWDRGIVGMQVGGERTITVPPSLGYGKRAQSAIPANSTLVFEVKLMEVK